MLRRFLLLALACLLLAPAMGRRSVYAEIDRYAVQAPASVEGDLDRLAGYLKKAGPSSEERARAIYRWIAARISYDTVTYFGNGPYPDQSAEQVLRRRNAVCAGYANLFEALASRCNLEARVIGGDIRRDPEDPVSRERHHAWNAVKVQGRWELLDPTWGSGYVDYKSQRFTRSFNPYYFLVPPEQLIFSHIPADKSWQLLPRPKTAQEIEALPRVTSYCFRYDVRPRERRGDLVANQALKLKFRTAPGVHLSANVYRGQTALENLTLVQPDKEGWTVDAVFPSKGDYKLVIWGSNNPLSQSLDYVLDYRVTARRATDLRFPTFTGDFLTRKARVELPRTYALSSAKKTTFSLLVPDATEVQLICGSQWLPLDRQGQWFRGTLTLPPGDVKVSARFPGSEMYQMLLRYRAD